jgi:hypothetical protein
MNQKYFEKGVMIGAVKVEEEIGMCYAMKNTWQQRGKG